MFELPFELVFRLEAKEENQLERWIGLASSLHEIDRGAFFAQEQGIKGRKTKAKGLESFAQPRQELYSPYSHASPP